MAERMVRVLRRSVPAYNDWTEEQIRDRLAALEEEIAQRPSATRESELLSQAWGLRTALSPDFSNKVHHRSNCWWVDAYEEGRWGKPRRFALVPAREVPDHAEGCQFCESGRLGTFGDERREQRSTGSDHASHRGVLEEVEQVVRLSSRVRVRDLSSGTETTWKVIHASAPKDAGALSAASAVGKALLGRRVGEVVTADTPKGARQFEVLELVA